MKKKNLLTPCQLVEIISLIEHQIFDANFYAKYGYFFDSLVSRNIAPQMEYPEEFVRTVNGIALFWNDADKLHLLYEATTCDLLYNLYVRAKTLTVYAHSLEGNIELPDSTLIEQFKFLFTRFYSSSVHLPLSEVHDAYLL